MRRSWFVWAIGIGVASIVLAAVIMRVTADDDSSPSAAAWAGSVCTSLDTWKTSIQSLTDLDGETLTPQTLKEKIRAGKTATTTLLSELEDLGAPDLESGDALKEQLASSATELQASFDSLREAAEKATETSSPAEFLKGLAALVPRFQALLGQVSATIQDVQDADVSADAKAELQSAFADAPACQQLQGNG